MIRPIRKEKISIYHDSFYKPKARHKKRHLMMKWLLLLICVIALTIINLTPSHAKQFSKNELLDNIGSGQMLLAMPNTMAANSQQTAYHNNYQNAILLNSSANVEVNGLVANVTLTQSFINQSDNTVNGLFVFPLPENSAVNHLHIQVADRIIEGKVMEKHQAKKVFEQAKRSGKKASLVVQHRPNLFTNHIANIAAHEQVTVTIKYFQHINYVNGKFTLRFPMKITPRYQAKAIDASTYGNLPANNESLHNESLHNEMPSKFVGQIAQALAEKANILPPVFTYKNNQPSNNIQLSVKLNAGVELIDITSSSHAIKVTNNQTKTTAHRPFADKETLTIDVGNVQVAMDRDFVLQWQPSPSNQPRLSVFKQKLAGEVYSLAMLLPPTTKESSVEDLAFMTEDQQTFARDITFIIDTSGSMQGQSIIQAKESLLFALQTLKERDSFNIIAFESSFRQAFNTTVMADQQNIYLARKFIANLNANGGTEMYQPLATALAMKTSPAQQNKAIKQVIFITDGAVSNELALFKLIHNTPHIPRLFTVGIGSAPNGYFMRKAAQFGRGSYTYIGKVNEVKMKMSALLNKISRPALRNINIQFQPLHLGSIEQYPKKIPDLYYGEPLVVAFKTTQMPSSLQVFGEQANNSWHQEISLTKQQESSGITPIWARAKIEDLLDGLVTGKPHEEVREKVLATSLLHQVMSPYSSFIAVEQEKTLTSDNSTKQTTAFPKTATGWQVPFISGVLLLILSLIMQARRAIKISKKSTQQTC